MGDGLNKDSIDFLFDEAYELTNEITVIRS